MKYPSVEKLLTKEVNKIWCIPLNVFFAEVKRKFHGGQLGEEPQDVIQWKRHIQAKHGGSHL
jgi:hypothetical protein